MDENLQRKINVCRRMGGKVEDLDGDINCNGVNETDFIKELDKEAKP